MRYVLFNYVHPDDVAAWEAWTPEEQAADVERHTGRGSASGARISPVARSSTCHAP